jgi:hypothetical protein
MPRGYGGVAILWKKSIDQYFRPTSDGSKRIQCIEINTETPHLIINVYLPTKSNNDQLDTYSDETSMPLTLTKVGSFVFVAKLHSAMYVLSLTARLELLIFVDMSSLKSPAMIIS